MNGVIAVRSLMVADTGLTTLVPEARIAAGSLPQGTVLPAISLNGRTPLTPSHGYFSNGIFFGVTG